MQNQETATGSHSKQGEAMKSVKSMAVAEKVMAQIKKDGAF